MCSVRKSSINDGDAVYKCAFDQFDFNLNWLILSNTLSDLCSADIGFEMIACYQIYNCENIKKRSRWFMKSDFWYWWWNNGTRLHSKTVESQFLECNRFDNFWIQQYDGSIALTGLTIDNSQHVWQCFGCNNFDCCNQQIDD